MKKGNILIAASIAAISLVSVSCSQNDDPEQPLSSTDNVIRFAAAAEFSRAGDITTNNLTSFNVYAYTGPMSAPNLFMDNVVVSKTGNNVWTYSPVQYWPADEEVDFYAFAPASWVGSAGPMQPVPYSTQNGVEDLVYAVSPNLTGNNEQPNAQVVFNFRHALSKLTVKLSSTDTTLKVIVSNVVMANISSKGNFSFPTSSTAETAAPENVGTWTDQNTPKTYMLQWTQTPSDSAKLTLTPTPTVIAAQGLGRGGVMFVIPQPLTYRESGFGTDNYIAVAASIYDAESGEKLWPNENTPDKNIVPGSSSGDGLLKFALSTSKYTQWQPGCHYIYNLVINSNSEMGAIEFGNPSVDTYIEVQATYE